MKGAAVLASVSCCALACAACRAPNWTPTPDEAFRAAPPPIAAGSRLRVPVIEQAVLANGLRVMTIQSPDAATLNLAFADRAAVDGAADRTSGLAAVTAFAMRSGTIQADGSIERRQELLGESSDFLITGSGTVFHLTALESDARAAFETLARVIQKPALDREALRLGRNAAKTRNMVEASNAVDGLMRLGARELFGGTSQFGRFRFGSEEDRSAIADDTVRRFYRARYQPRNSALLVVGPLDPTRALALARDNFESWRPADAAEEFRDSTPVLVPEEKRTHGIGVIGPDSFAEVVMSLPCPRRDSPDTVAADLTAILLADLSSYGLHAELRHDAGSSYGVHARCAQDRSGGVFRIELDTEPAKFGAALKAIIGQLERLRANPPSSAEMSGARALYLGRHALWLSTNVGLREMLADQFLTGLPVDYTARLEAAVEGTTAIEIQRYAQRYLDSSNMVVAVHGAKFALDATLSGLGNTRWLGVSAAEHGD